MSLLAFCKEKENCLRVEKTAMGHTQIYLYIEDNKRPLQLIFFFTYYSFSASQQ